MQAKRKSKLDRKEKIVSLLFVLPPLIGFLIFTLGTMVFSVGLSFTNFNPRNISWKWVQFDNYIDLFTNLNYSTSFFEAIGNTFVLMLAVPIGMVIGLILAVIISNKTIKGGKLFKVVVYLPAISSAIAINIVFRYIFNGEFGLLNYILGQQIRWLGTDPHLIKIAIIVKNVWAGIGGTMILYLSGILSVPPQLYEASDIDGANVVQKFFKITLPMLTPITFYMIVMGIIGGLQSYIDSQVFAGGAQGARTIVYFVWQRGIFQNRYGLASAASVLLGIGIMIFTIIQFALSKRWVHAE